MTPRAAATLAATGLVAAAFMARAAADRQAQASASSDAGDGSTALDLVNPIGQLEAGIQSYQTTQAMQDINTQAFLAMIAASEGTDRAADPYRVCYAYAWTIRSFTDHPAITGEWKGDRLSDAMCKGAGFGPGCVSTAAGRYQLVKPTWLAAKRALKLADFSPASQDAAAVYLIRKRGAIDDVQAGRVADAITKCRLEWASLPGAGYGQPERKLASLVDAFTRAGGALA